MDGDGFPVERRIRAAMALAGIDFAELARRIGQPGMKARTLRGMATPSEPQTAQPHHLRYIADACGVSPSFFAADFSGDLAADSDLRGRLQNAETQLASLVGAVTRLEERTRQLELEGRERDADLLERETEAAARQAGAPRDSSAAAWRAQDDRDR